MQDIAQLAAIDLGSNSFRLEIGKFEHEQLQRAERIEGAAELADGIEQRSRYWLGHDPKLRAFHRSISLDALATKLDLKRRMAGTRVAYEQLLHDQIEFTHLSTFLSDLYAEFA